MPFRLEESVEPAYKTNLDLLVCCAGARVCRLRAQGLALPPRVRAHQGALGGCRQEGAGRVTLCLANAAHTVPLFQVVALMGVSTGQCTNFSDHHDSSRVAVFPGLST